MLTDTRNVKSCKKAVALFFVTFLDYLSVHKQVTLCIVYANGAHEVIYPDIKNCSIPAELEKCVIEGDFDTKSSYDISLLVEENGYQGTNAWDGKISSEAEPICKYMAQSS